MRNKIISVILGMSLSSRLEARASTQTVHWHLCGHGPHFLQSLYLLSFRKVRIALSPCCFSMYSSIHEESYTRAFFLTCGCSQYLMIIKFFRILCSRPATSVACWRKRTVFAILCESKSFGEDERNPDRKVLSRTCRAGTE